MINKDKIIAILRGIKPEECNSVFGALIQLGIKNIEIPLNSPDPFLSIENMINEFGTNINIGAGTVIKTDEVLKLKSIGAKFVVSPNCDEEIIKTAIDNNLEPFPGVFSPTEALNAIKWGAKNLKLFPASTLGLAYFKAIKEILPTDVKVWAVGGINSNSFAEWLDAGIHGFGIGSSLYKKGDSAADVKTKAALLRL
jgi:2-dehydro-3-deoxyphosphogalactonate aldolase